MASPVHPRRPLMTPIRLVAATALAAMLSGAFVAVAGAHAPSTMAPLDRAAAAPHVQPVDTARPPPELSAAAEPTLPISR